MNPGKTKTSLGAKIALSCLSLLLSLLLLEAGLRLTGLLLARRDKPELNPAIRSKVILCVGDSYTFNGNVKPEDSWSRVLQGYLNRKPQFKNWTVVNQGVCEFNSAQLRSALPQWLRHYRPAVVILLVGSANRFNLRGFDFNDNNPDWLKGILGWLEDLKTAKLLRITWLNLKARTLPASPAALQDIIANNFQNNAENAYRHYRGMIYLKEIQALATCPEKNPSAAALWLNAHQGSPLQGIALCQAQLRRDPEDQGALCALGYLYFCQGDYGKADLYYNQALKQHPESEFVRCQAAFYYGRLRADELYRQGAYAAAAKYFLNALKVDPSNHFNYYQLGKIFEFQSGAEASQVAQVFKQLERDNPGLKDNSMFQNYYAFFTRRASLDSRIQAWLRQDLEAVFNLCRMYRAKILVQNYPLDYPLANSALKQLAQEHGLILVDNCAIFKTLMAREGEAVYLEDSDHCTPRGYRIMAGNIFTALSTGRLLVP